MRAIDYTGRRNGKLVAIRREGMKWECQCDCGNLIWLTSKQMKANTRTSCGCDEVKQEFQCKYRFFQCSRSAHGKCCRYCDRYEKCEERCYNSPELCGSIDNI